MDSRSLREALAEAFGAENVLCDEPLSAHTTFAIGGPADFLVRPRDIDQVKAVLDACRMFDAPLHVLGYGSDVLVADAGVRGVVMQVADNLSAVEVGAGGLVYAQAGASNAAVAECARQAGLAGYEFASGIPGGIGGAAIMNAGAYGGEFKDVALSLVCLTREGELVEVGAAQAEWGYRRSMMDDEGMVVLAALLRLKPDDPQAVQERMDDFARRRSEKQPLDLPSAGSTFKRPEGRFAGKLIQDARMQGVRVGGAQVSEKHAGFLVNVDGATAADVLELIELVRSRVFEDAGVLLEPEVRLWGFSE